MDNFLKVLLSEGNVYALQFFYCKSSLSNDIFLEKLFSILFTNLSMYKSGLVMPSTGFHPNFFWRR